MVKGINITDEVKKQFNYVIDKYYRRKNKISLQEAYSMILKEFYSDKYGEDDEVKYHVWGKDRIPTYQQFYYWFKKNENTKRDIIFRESEKILI